MFGKGAPPPSSPPGKGRAPPTARGPPGALPPKAKGKPPPSSGKPPGKPPPSSGKPPGKPPPSSGKPPPSGSKTSGREEKKQASPKATRYRGITQNDDDDDAPRTMAKSPMSGKTVETKMGIAGLGPTDPDDAAKFEGYLMKRIGVGGPSTHYWEIRFFRIDKNNKNETVLFWWTSHFQDNSKGKLVIKPGVSTCMSFERDAYDEGRRRNLIGVQAQVKGSPVIMDCPNGPLKQKWLEVLGQAGCSNQGEIPAEKTNTQSVKEGWIVKRGAVVGTWHRRFLVLLPQMAMYYKWKRDKRPLGVIPLTANGKVSVAPANKGKNCLALIPNIKGDGDAAREYYIRCYDSDALKSWLSTFSQAMKGIR